MNTKLPKWISWVRVSWIRYRITLPHWTLLWFICVWVYFPFWAMFWISTFGVVRIWRGKAIKKRILIRSREIIASIAWSWVGVEWYCSQEKRKSGGEGGERGGRCWNREIVRQRSYKESYIDTSDFLVSFLAIWSLPTLWCHAP